MKLYTVSDDYIEFLQNFDSRVLSNKNQTRPYVGIVLIVNNLEFFVPLTSPKEKHKKMKNAIDFMKLDAGNLGALNFNNMIPISSTEIISLNLGVKTDTYSILLQKQMDFINSNRNGIQKKADTLYKYVVISKHAKKSIVDRCVDFKLLEDKCQEYRNNRILLGFCDVTKEEVNKQSNER